MPEELYTSRDFCELAEEFEELKRENEELVSDKTYLINAAMDGGDKYHYTAHDIAYRDLERKCKALEAENVALREYIEGLDPRWIPVSERLPELDQDVLAVVEGEIKVGHFYQELDFIEPDDDDEEGNIYFSVFDDGLLVATHWFPIPDGLEEREK